MNEDMLEAIEAHVEAIANNQYVTKNEEFLLLYIYHLRAKIDAEKRLKEILECVGDIEEVRRKDV